MKLLKKLESIYQSLGPQPAVFPMQAASIATHSPKPLDFTQPTGWTSKPADEPEPIQYEPLPEPQQDTEIQLVPALDRSYWMGQLAQAKDKGARHVRQIIEQIAKTGLTNDADLMMACIQLEPESINWVAPSLLRERHFVLDAHRKAKGGILKVARNLTDEMTAYLKHDDEIEEVCKSVKLLPIPTID